MLTTPAMLARTTLYVLLAQVLAIVIVAALIPHGAAWLTTAGFVTPHYDTNVFAGKVAPIPWTDPVVYFSVQTLLQMLSVALGVAAVSTLIRTNPWQHGALPDSLPPTAEKSGKPAGRRPADAPTSPGSPPSAPPSPPAPPTVS